MQSRSNLALVLVLVALTWATKAALAVGPHSMKLHLEWNRCVKEEDWDDWIVAFDRADTDGNGRLGHRDVPRLFKEHFAIVHDKMHEHRKEQFSPAEEHHFEQDVQHFLDYHEERGTKFGEQIMTWAVFKKLMLEFMKHKTKERETLLEVAQHIY